MIYIKDDLDSISMDEYMTWYHQMPDQRKAYTGHFALQKDKLRCVCAYNLLSKALKEEYNIAKPPIFYFGKYGKPYLLDYPSIFFNLSHCDNAVVCAISSYEVGVDVEDVKQVDADIIASCCCESENLRIRYSDNPNLEFVKMWTMKESYLKLNGIGLNDNVKVLFQSGVPSNIHFSLSVNEQKRYVCTCCVY